MADVTPEDFLQTAVLSRASDVVLNPGRLGGSLVVKSGFETLHATPMPMDALYPLAAWFCERAGLSPGQAMFELGLGSFEYRGARVRVGRTSTATGPLVRIRIQAPRVLQEAHQGFLAGDFGGRETLPFLMLGPGLVLVIGQVSSGKTSALYHLVAAVGPSAALVVSEVQELDLPLVHHRPDRLPHDWQAVIPQDCLVVFDEMDEQAKIAMASELAGSRPVLASITAPTLAFALRKFATPGPDLARLRGALKVTWQPGPSGARTPHYVFFPVGEGRHGCCPVCGRERPDAGPCPGCGLGPVKRYLDREVLRRMRSPEGFRALDRLEEEWS